MWSIDDLTKSGIFRRARRATDALDETEGELLRLLATEAYPEFMQLAVRSRKNILVSGLHRVGQDHLHEGADPGDSGNERLITIEDAKELIP